jgi:RNA polymerase sigma-70 factor, ECF subfamily
MRWRVRSNRHSADFPPDGEAALRPLPGLGGVELAGAGLGGSGLGRSGLGSHGAGHISARSVGPKPGSAAGLKPNGAANGGSSPENGRESAHRAQPSGTDGVPEDMATLVLDNSAMGTGSATRLEAPQDSDAVVNAALDPASDAAVMLRVAAGDEVS